MAKYTQDNRLLRITTPFDDNYLLINSITGTEAISQLYSYKIELLHEEKEGFTIPEVVDHKKILGQAVSVEATQLDGRGRMFHGIVNSFSQGSRGILFTQYWITVVPVVWILTQQSQSRIFQQKTVPAILKLVFAGFENAIAWELDYDYKPRNYCVQYRESDFDFAARLMAEEGINYYFEHAEDKPKMIVSDKPRFTRDCPGKTDVTYMYEVTDGKWESHIRDWDTDYKLQSGMVSLRDHHIQQPGKKLAVTSPTKFKVGGNGEWELYDYPGGYARKFDGVGPGGDKTKENLDHIIPDGNRTAQTAMEVLDAQFMTGSGTSDVTSLTPGHKFKMVSNPIAELNGEYVITSIAHTAYQTPAYVPEEKAREAYVNDFKALAHGREGSVPFRPEQVTEKPIVYGAQTATVVGSPGEEIYTDEFGRIKVQFHWDRQGQNDGADSCWLPVAQSWAGNGWGSMFIPRVGMEVIVHFLEGNADCPIVTGCVYHPMNMPPYELPKEKTKSTIKTYSTPKGGGFNEFRFEDKKGDEQIFIHGQKSLDVRIKSDRRELIGNDRHLIVKRDKREWIERDVHSIVDRHVYESIGVKGAGDYHREVKGKVALKTGGGVSHDIGGSLGEKVGGSHSEEAGQDIYIKAGMKVVIEAGVQLTLKGPGGFIDINPAGVVIQGTMVLINSGGAAGSGQAVGLVKPTEPEEAHIADNADPGSTAPTYKNQIKKIPAYKLPTYKKPTNKPDKKKKSWIEIELKDDDGNPVAGEPYRVEVPDGSLAEGTLDEKGFARVEGIDPGNCVVSFPRRDEEVVKKG